MRPVTFVSGVALSSLLSAALTLAMLSYARPPNANAQVTRQVAEEFVLVDGQGMERARLSVSQQGETLLELVDEDGRTRVELRARKSGTGLRMLGLDGRPGITMFGPGDEEDETVGFILNPRSANNVHLQAHQGQGFLSMLGPGGLVGLSVGSFDRREDPPRLTVLGATGAAEVRVDEQGPAIQLHGPGPVDRRETLWQAP